jgi:hypothetical protein
MKNKLILLLTIILFISCRKPADPVVEEPTDPVEDLLIYNHWGTFNTVGKCLDIDISDSVLVAAANFNGFFVFSIDSENQTLHTVYHGTDLDPNMGDNRAERIILSKTHGIVFILDRYDKSWMHKLYGTQYHDGYIEDCFNGVWLSTSLDDREDGIGIFSLVQHSSAQSDTSGTVGDYDQYSTSLVWKNLTDVGPEDEVTDNGSPECEYIYNFSILPKEVFYADSILSITNGELGIQIFKQADNNIYCTRDINGSQEILSIEGNEFCVENYTDISTFVTNYKNCCETSTCPGGFGECPWLDPDEEGFGGVFSSANGIIPAVFSEFDTPGEVTTVFSFENTIFAGLSTSNGCLIQYIGDEGELLNNYLIAEGFSVNGIHYDNDLLALACGHDGALIYQWDGAGRPNLLGRIATSYANKIKVQGNRVFVATEDGIDIFEIER